VLAIGLVAAVRAIVMRSAAGAESRIDELVDRLAAARSEQRVRAIGARAVSAQEEERRAIARDLHDSLGPGRTAIRIQAELLRGGDGASAADRAAKKIAETSDATIEEVRRAIARLGPAVLDELGLSRAVARLIEDAKENASLSIESRLDGAEGLSAALESTCYRIVQEALTNVARHAGARTARVTITREGDDVVVEIEDDGRGAEPTGDAGHGLRAMRERAELLGGTLEIERDGGTKVRAVLPLRS
jgi:two-component system sensor histidine kinase UhpB